MKEWFKYEHGFVNIDDHNIYLTNTGNWSETKDLPEKAKQTRRRDALRKLKIAILLFVVGFIFLFLTLLGIVNRNGHYFVIIEFCMAIWYLYQYLRTEMGQKFRLPFSKVKSVLIEDTTVTIHFYNGYDKDDKVVLQEVEGKGILLLQILQESHVIR